MRRARLNFTSETKREAIARAKGICECHRVPQLMALLDCKPCGVKLTTGHIHFEHVICDALRPDNSLDNAAVLTTTCWRLKTDQYDKPVIAQAKRRFDRHHGIKPTPRQVLAGTFRSGIAKKMDGRVLDRATGRPWHERNQQPELNTSSPQPAEFLAVTVRTVRGV